MESLNELSLLYSLLIALGLGLLVGLQREWVDKSMGGISTFPLITLAGTLAGAVGAEEGAWVIAAGLLSLAALIAVRNALRVKDKRLGLTTEIAALCMYLVGAGLAVGYLTESIVVAGVIAILLQWKRPLHEIVRKIDEKELQAIFRLVLVGLVILPILPNKVYGPYQVTNPFEIWLMVVLIVGISLGGYLGYRFFGAGTGTFLAGFFGGLISSTATTVSFARRSRAIPANAPVCAAVIVLSSTIVFARVLVEMAIVYPEILRFAAGPIVIMMLFMVLITAVVYLAGRKSAQTATDVAEPPDLRSAIAFGLMYMLVLIGVAAAREEYGNAGLYIVSALSGLTDMDAITLSTTQLVKAEALDAQLAWRAILVGALANLFFKACAVAILGTRRLLFLVVICFGCALVGGIGLIVFWPDSAIIG